MPDAAFIIRGSGCNELRVLLAGALTVMVDLTTAACDDIILTKVCSCVLCGSYVAGMMEAQEVDWCCKDHWMSKGAVVGRSLKLQPHLRAKFQPQLRFVFHIFLAYQVPPY